MRADLFLMSPMTLASFRPEPIPRVRVSQALAVEEVAAAAGERQVWRAIDMAAPHGPDVAAADTAPPRG